MTRLVTVVEQPSDENNDEFTVKQSDGTTTKIHVSKTLQYLRVGAEAVLTIKEIGSQVICDSLVLPQGKRSRFPTKPGTVKRQNGKVTVSNGYRWISIKHALEEDLLDPSEVGTHVKSAKICSGAIGGPSEYEIFVHIWKIGSEYLLDERENGGGYELVTSQKAVEARIAELRRGEVSVSGQE